MEEDKKQWTPWGDRLEGSHQYLQLPHVVIPILNRCGYNPAQILVVLGMMTFVIKSTRIRVTYGDIANRAGCSIGTVFSTLKRLRKNGLNRVYDGGPRRTASEYDVQGFLAWLAAQQITQGVESAGND